MQDSSKKSKCGQTSVGSRNKIKKPTMMKDEPREPRRHRRQFSVAKGELS